MPIHDWTRVDAGIFHHFHHEWVSELPRALNRGLLPPGYYALAEQIAGGLGPDVLTLKAPSGNGQPNPPADGGLLVAAAPPRVRFHARSDRDEYAAKAKVVKVRHTSDHSVVAVIEIVSPGNKAGLNPFRSFVSKAVELLDGGVHLLVIDLFPPTAQDPRGIHAAIWRELGAADEFLPPPDAPLTLVSYRAGPGPEAYVEPTAVGSPLVDMPVFLTRDRYVPMPLEATYQSAWEAVPAYWRNVIEGRPGA